MTLEIPMWFVILWAIVLVLGCISNFFFTKKFDKLSDMLAEKTTTKIADTLKDALDKVDLSEKRCKNTQKQGSASQKSQKK